MLLVLDTNIFVFAFSPIKDHPCKTILREITTNPDIVIHVPRTVVNEVRNNLHANLFTAFIRFMHEFGIIEEDILVPFEIGAKYEAMGLKPADAFIGSFTEWVGAEILVSENRHFLSRQSNLPFKVLTAEKCLKLLK